MDEQGIAADGDRGAQGAADAVEIIPDIIATPPIARDHLAQLVFPADATEGRDRELTTPSRHGD
jgi:hypothetical protein